MKPRDDAVAESVSHMSSHLKAAHIISRRILGNLNVSKRPVGSRSLFSVGFSRAYCRLLELGCCLPPHVSSAAIVSAKTRTYRKRRSDVSEMDSVSSTY